MLLTTFANEAASIFYTDKLCAGPCSVVVNQKIFVLEFKRALNEATLQANWKIVHDAVFQNLYQLASILNQLDLENANEATDFVSEKVMVCNSDDSCLHATDSHFIHPLIQLLQMKLLQLT